MYSYIRLIMWQNHRQTGLFLIRRLQIMNQTKKLYDNDSYAVEFDAVVVACEEKTGKDTTVYEVILDQTLFFPEEGGQSPDQGVIHGKEVLDVQIKKGIILHTMKEPLTVGAPVHGKIDWKHRFNNMQQHSGEHIFSGLVHQTYGYDNVGFHLSNQTVTMDFSGVLTIAQIEEIERRVNEVIQSNVPVIVTYPTKEELSTMNYRSKIEIEGQVRIVTIPGADVCACCAPHVKSTGEIGMLKVMSVQNWKGGVRLSILCGFRALEEFRKRNALLSELTNLLSTNHEALPETIQKLKTANQNLKYELTEVKKRHLQETISTIPETQEDVILFEDGIDANVMRSAVNELTKKHAGICAVFTGNDHNGYQFILGSASMDVKPAMELMKSSLAARGGGSSAMVQGSLQAKKETILSLLLQN